MKQILITGGAGFIGASLAHELVKDPENQIIIVDNLLTGKTENLPNAENCTFFQCNVNNRSAIEQIMTRFRFDYVFHYAAVVGVKRTLDNPLMVLSDIEGLKNIFDLSSSTGVKHIYYSSSSEVYGEPVELPQHETTTPLNSKLPYSIVKNLGEAFCKTYQKERGLNFTIFRFFNTYGPLQSTDFVVSKFMRAALSHQDINIYGDGNQSRTFCYIDDNISATTEAFYQQSFVNEVLNIGSDVEISINELANTIIECTESNSSLQYLPPLPEGDMTRRQPDITKMKTLLQREPISLRAGISQLIQKQLSEEVDTDIINGYLNANSHQENRIIRAS